MSRGAQDLIGVLRGLQMVAEACGREHLALTKHLWSNSSVRELLAENVTQTRQTVRRAGEQPADELRKVQQVLQETTERGYVVARGICSLLETKLSMMPQLPGAAAAPQGQEQRSAQPLAGGGTTGAQADLDAANLDISSITLEEFEDILSKRNKNRQVSLRTPATQSKQVPIVQAAAAAAAVAPPARPAEGILERDTQYVDSVLRFVANPSAPPNPKQDIDVPELSKVAKQRRVPASRIGRMASFGGLFAGLGIGTLNELTKGALGMGGSKTMREALLSPANAERIVDTLCKVRGAALKIGQILSIQDSSVVSPQLAKAFERVRQAADYMPDWQVERVMNTQLGPDWRQRLTSFEDKPFAAASIGQVHRATLTDGMQVAIKIQYPGVAQSIESDIDNLVGMLKVWDVFPQGFFIDNVVRVAKRELQWEVDYEREAEYTEKFRQMIAPYPEYYVPRVVRDLTTSSVLTTELIPGVPLDKCFDLSYEHRAHIAASVLKLCLRELFEIECMQTDPNWSNFLYDAPSRRLMLIDFGSTRFYKHEFIRNYRQVIISAAENNRQGVLDMSREMGFLTGYETKQMEQAHVDAVMILGEIFRYDGDFDFGKQNTTERLAALVPTMVAHRLCPPPEEIYSIHRKLSGIFLLCARLNVRLNCLPFYREIILGKFKD
ncbi:atypical kinase COQ8B, mitochondrial [Drosophila guanche]|uniref:Blast:Chaperone activity of bc1 complex-like, mitochondrial n=1 Tax=Drosophila guanche TaxID=7266 RepID=A0A3B0K7T2_DROGU|nr:atypical kinase COQ8B, mitochondrial [Drosophila guanche]SPP89383.1 blast:Chaperone activity of bc1 complex-like%2C mitochondrial [Drosophila guanche]